MTGRRLPLVLAALACAWLGAPRVAWGQSSSFTALLVVQPFPSPFVADWQRNPQMAVLTLLYSGTGRSDFRILGVATSATRGELARVISPPLSYLTGPVAQVFTSADILDWNTVSRNQSVTDAILRTGVLPEGPIQFCAHVQTLSGVELTVVCTGFTVALPDPPQLIFPTNGGSTVGAQPVFQWTPVMAPPELGVTYRVRIVEQLAGQNPQTAITADPTWFESSVTGPPMLVYPLDGLPLDPAKQYVWQVQALDGSGQPLTRGGQSSEIWTFTVAGPGGGVGLADLPDTVDLIPGVARLMGLKSADIERDPADYVVTGALTLEVAAPFQARLRVRAQNLDFDRTTIAAGGVLVRSGALSGSLAAGDVPASLGASPLQFTEIDYGAATGLSLKGRLSLPGAASGVNLGGQVQVTAAGLYGTLTADAGTDSALVALGQDPARLLVRQARVTLPGGGVSLAGSLELFARDVGCGGVTATIGTDGSLAANVACMASAPVPLGAGGSRAQLALRSVTGSFAAAAGAASGTYNLSVSAELRLDAGVSAAPGSGGASAAANCGGSLALMVANGAVSTPTFAPRCDASESDADLGWLHARLSSLALQRFAYTRGQGFDFALTVDLLPWVPAISGLDLSAASGVTITPSGLGIPALDATISRPAFTLGGFGVKVTHVRLPAFTLSWADWSAASADGFKFSVDAEVSFPSLPVGAPACLTAQPYTISGATIANGRFKAHLDEHRFSPACGFTLGLGASSSADTSSAGGTGAGGAGAAGTAASGAAGASASDPYQALQEPPVGSPPLPDSSARWPGDPAAAAALKQTELGTIEAADSAYRLGLNNPACDSTCRSKLLHAVDSLRDTVWATWHARDFGALQAQLRKCIGSARQAQLTGLADTATSGPCNNANLVAVNDSVLKLWLPKLIPPKPPASVDCTNDVGYAMTVVIGAERQLALLGAPESDSSTIQQMAPMFNYCRTKAVNRLLATCKSKPTFYLANADMAAVTGAERQAELMGLPEDTTTRPLTAADCPLQGTSTTSARSIRPPPGLGPPPIDSTIRGAGPEAPPNAAADTTGSATTGITFQIDSVGGDLEVAFAPYLVIAKVPSIAGSIVLPPIFTCSDTTKRQVPLQSQLRFGPQGQLDGTILGFLPSCPINLAAVQVTVNDASLTFSTAGGAQSIVLAAAATASFTLASSPVTGQGSVAIDLLRGRLLSGSLGFQGPFQMSLPRQPPVLSFTLQSASLDAGGVHVDGRAQLDVPGGSPISATFDRLTINPQTLGITAGQVLFDVPFALEVGVTADGSLTWGARPLGAAISVQTGVRADLPVKIALGPGGLTASGSGSAHLVFGGRDVDSLVTVFSSGFALGFGPPGVSRGSVDFQRNGVSLGYIDAAGFHPNVAYFAGAALPARLPLPSADVAYLELRDSSGALRVSTQASGNGIRIFTAPGATVPLVLPALQLGRSVAPRLLVQLDLTLDPLGENVALGSISATVPPADADAFDLSGAGLPVALESVAYARSPGGGYQWSLSAALRLFGQRQEPSAGDSVQLTLDGTGRLGGTLSITSAQSIPLVPGSQNLVLTLQRVRGAFDASLPSRSIKFHLAATGGLVLNLGAGQTYEVGATVGVSDQGVTVDSIASAGADTARWLDMSVVRLGFQKLRVPKLAWDPTGGFTFQILFDGLLQFPSLGAATLPPVADISLTNQGITLPAYEVPNLNLDLSPVGGFAAKLLAFRVGQVSWNWFTGQAPANWGFGFDVELGFGTLMAGLPPAIQSAKVRVLNAGLTNGRLTGTIEPVNFPTPIDLGIGKLTSLGGQLPADNSPFALTAGFDLDLSAAFPVCSGASLKKTGSTLSIASNGWVSGTLSGVLPSCAANLGPFAVSFGQSDVTFSTAGSGSNVTRSVVVALAATVKFPGVNAGDTVSASGSLQFDALQGRWLSGSIALAQPFRYQPADGNPYLAFTVQQASLDSGGLHFTGQAALNTKDGAQVTAQFNGFTLGLPDFKVKAGSVTFLGKFALGVGIANGSLTWGAYSVTAPRPSGPAFRAVVPDTVTIDANGLYVGGTATADLAFGDSVFGSLAVNFTGGFRVGFAPLAVTAGRASFVLGSDEIAHVDAGGFWPGNLFGVLPIPAKLGLPSADIAYLELRDGANNLLIDMQTSPNGIELKTKAGAAVRLVVPALAASGQAPPAANVSFDVVVNQTNLQFVSGAVTVQADAGGAPLFSLDQLGIPLGIRGISWEKVSGGATYGLTLAARITLPPSLDGLDIDVPNLTLSASGLSGEIRLGSYIQGNTSTAPLVSKSFMSDTLVVAVTGADLKFGGSGGTSFALAGYLSSALFNSGQGSARINWTGAVSPSAFSLQLDPTSGQVTLPIAVAQFQPTSVGSEPALLISADAQEFKVRMSGVLTVPTISPTLAVTIAGLQVGTKGVVFPTVSVSGLNQQQFDLFGATFRLADSVAGGTTVYPAIAVGVKQGAVALTLSGAVDFLGNTSRFYGLTVSTTGSVSIAAASLISKPLVLVQNVLTVDALKIQNNALETDLSVTLPDPLNGAGPQKLSFTVGADGRISGGAQLALINEQPSLTGNSTTHFQLGSLATIHLRYLGLTLDFANLKQNSAVQVVSDVYLQNTDTNRIMLGTVNGNTVQPGVKIGFDGSVTWGNLALASQFTFDFDVVKLKVTGVSFPPQQSGFAISLSGDLGLAVDEVKGSLAFKDFVVTSQGQVQFSPSGVEGGSFSVGGVVSLAVTGFAYSATPLMIQLKGGGIPTSGAAGAAGAPGTQTVSVLSYLTFGGSFEIDSVVGGGVDQFLVYRAADQGLHLLIRNAHLNVDDMVDFRADFQYDQNPNGFAIVAAGSGTIMGYGPAALVGAIERDGAVNRFGMFAKVDGLKINITPYLRLDGVGGGFFLNPRQQWLDMVRTAANVSQTAGLVIAPPANAKFALMFYGDMAFLQGVISGRSLLTVTDQQLLMDGTVTILGQDGRLSGDHHLAVGLKQAYAEGNMNFKIAYGSVITGGGPLSFFVYDDKNWGIYGTTQVTVIDFLKGTSDLFVGPPGFYVKSQINAGYNVAILSLSAVDTTTVWKISSTGEWGGYTALGISASVLGGLASATGTLRGALIIQSQPLIFAAAELKASVAGQSWDGWVWAKFQNSQVTGGLGADSSIIAAIAAAQNVASEMTSAKNDAQSAITQVQNLGPPAVALTTSELAAAYRNLQGYSGLAYALAAGSMIGIEGGYAAYADPVPIQTYKSWYVGVLRQSGAPGDSAAIAASTDSINNLFTAAEAQRPQVQSRIAALGLSIQTLAANAANPPLPSGSPVRSATLGAPVTQDVVGADGLTHRQVTSGPGFDVDAGAASTQATVTQQASQLADATDLAVRQQIAALETGLASVRASTAAADSAALPVFVGRYAAIESGAERQLAAQADYLLQRRAWTVQQLTALRQRQDSIAGPNGWIAAKTAALVAAGQPTAKTGALYQLVTDRLTLLQTFVGQSTLVTQFQADYNQATTMDQRWTTLTKNADTAGVQLWYSIGDAGMSDAITQAGAAFDTLQAQAAARLATIQGAHAQLSQSLAGLYQVQADATGALYDLYDRYLASREAGTPVSAPATRTISLATTTTGKVLTPATPSASDLRDSTVLVNRRAQLAQDLTVPRINGVQVTAMGTSPYTAQISVSWSAYHPSGVYEFELLDQDAGSAGASALLSNGSGGTAAAFRFTPSISAASTLSRTVSVGARGGAGFLGTGRTSYTLTFQPGGSAPPAVSGGSGLTADNTPPSTPVVTLPDPAQRLDSLGVNTAWTSDPSRVAAQWSADDPESGVSLYEYALWSTPTGTSPVKGGISAPTALGAPPPVLRGFTAIGGRTEATIDQLGLKAGQPVYVAVRATNGQGGVSAAGVSIPLRYDPTPPVWAPGAAITQPLTAFLVQPVLALPVSAACPLPPPALPGTPPPPPLLTPPPLVIAWAGSLTASAASAGATPQIQLTRPDASDPESGVAAYYYDVSTQPGDTVFAPSWRATSARSTALTVSGAPLDYQNQFWVTLVAKNTAGALSRTLSYGPFRIPDPTPPTTPAFCAGSGAVAGQLAAQITTPASDPETQVAGYQYRIRTAQGAEVRAWPAGTTTDWAAGVTNAVATGSLIDGQNYLVDVRAINTQGEVGNFATSGPVLYDLSAPPTPTASVTIGSAGPALVVTALTDPHTGLTALQWAVGTSQTTADVQPWISSAVASAGGTITLPFATTLPTGTTLWLQVRSVNGTGLPSTIYSATFIIPAVTKLAAPLLPAPRLP